MKARTSADVQAKVIAVEKEQGGVWSALLLAPEIAETARPMQFVEVRVGQGSDPFLRRPFGLSLIEKESGLIGITWAVVGKGTSMMTEWMPGDTVSVLGPLGNGLNVRKSAEGGGLPLFNPMTDSAAPCHIWLIGGGTGLAPLYPLAKACREKGPVGNRVTLFYGSRSKDLLMDTGKFDDLGCDVRLCTEDDSAGAKGFVTVALKEALKEALPALTSASHTAPLAAASGPAPSSLAGTTLSGSVSSELSLPVAVACGPTPMLQAVKMLLAASEMELYLSLEGRMACGTGLCKGCAVKAAPPREGYLHVCSDGPVFPANDVLLGGER